MRSLSWLMVFLALLNVAFLVCVPLLANNAADRLEFSSPDALPAKPQIPKQREKPVIPADQLQDALQLPRVDKSPTDEHSKEAYTAYEAGLYLYAFGQYILSLDSTTPLDENELYNALLNTEETTRKTNGREANAAVEEALDPILREQNPQDVAVRLNNAAAMLVLYYYSEPPKTFPADKAEAEDFVDVQITERARELSYQAADLQPSYCPALLNLTLFDRSATNDPKSEGSGTWTDYYPAEGCDDPALKYYLAQNSIHQTDVYETRGRSYHDYIDQLEATPGWAGLAHSLKGDAYYRRGTVGIYDPREGVEEGFYRSGRRSFTNQRYLKLALQEYKAALALQPDDQSLQHGLALVHLQLGKADTRDDLDKKMLDEAINEAEAALKAAPYSPRLQQTLVEAFEEKGDYATASRLQRYFLSGQPSIPTPLALVPFTPISHGADIYSELDFTPTAERHPGAGALLDEDVIEPFAPSPVAPEVTFMPSDEASAYRAQAMVVAEQIYEDYVPENKKASRLAYGPNNPMRGNLENRYSSGFQYYLLLRDDLLSGNYAAFEDDLTHVPQDMLDTLESNEHFLLLVATERLLDQPTGSSIPAPEIQELIDTFTAGWIDYAVLRGDPYVEPERRGNDLFYLAAGNLFRHHKRYDDAVRIYGKWLTELEHDHASVERRAGVEESLGEAHFLNGDNYEALAAFDRAEDLVPGWPPYLVRQAFMYEKLERYDEAATLYDRALARMHRRVEGINPDLPTVVGAGSYIPDSYQASKHKGDVLLRQAEAAEQARDRTDRTVREKYLAAAGAYREALDQFDTLESILEDIPSTAAANNLGVALLMTEDYEVAIETLEVLVQSSYDDGPDALSTPTGVRMNLGGKYITVPPSLLQSMNRSMKSNNKIKAAEAYEKFLTKHSAKNTDNEPSWKQSVMPDGHNPIFRLNLGWAYQLNGEPKKAAAQYLSAVKSDPSSYAALNDLGVLAAEGNDVDAAKGYFDAALHADRKYDHAAFNMGVALLHSGPENFLAAQHYFGRAVAENPALSETSYDYISDNELYFLDLSLLDKVPGDWQFSTHAQKSTGGLSLLVIVLLLGRITYGYASTTLQGTLIGNFFSRLRKQVLAYLGRYELIRRVLGGLVKVANFGVVSSGGWWMTPLALLVSAPATVVVMGWGLIQGDSGTKSLMVAMLLYLVVVSLLVHHAGHALAAWWFGMHTQEAYWPAGIVSALALVVVGGPAVAPVPASMIQGEGREREGERSLVYLAGPVASIIFAAMLFVLFLMSHIPLLRFGAILSLGVAVVSLLVLPPLDGALVGKGRYRRLLFWAGVAITVLWALVYFSNQFNCINSPGQYCWGIWF